jgi:DNA-binding MarR family transcriptional regulator
MVLWQRDGMSVGELGERLYLDSGTLTPLLKRMEAAGWLHRERAADDERRVVVTLSPEGRALRRRALDDPRRLAAATGCSNDELASLTQRLQQLRDQILDSTRGAH